MPEVEIVKASVVRNISVENMRSIAVGKGNMAVFDEKGTLTLRSTELEGSFSFPGFQNTGYTGDFYTKPQSFNYEIALPDNVGTIIGDGELVISVQTEKSWSFMSPEKKWKLGRYFL